MGGEPDSVFDQTMDATEAERLKYLGFVHSTSINAVVCLSNLYVSAKDKSGPLKTGVESVEGAVKTVVGPVYDKYHGVPVDVLKFVDRKMDESVTSLDNSIPPVVKQVSNKALSATQKAPEVARIVVSEIKRDGVVGTAKNTYVKYEPVAKEMYSKYEPVAEKYAVSTWQALNKIPLFPQVAEAVIPTAAYCSEKYNQTVLSKAEDGYRVANYLPLVPTEKISKLFGGNDDEAETEILVS